MPDPLPEFDLNRFLPYRLSVLSDQLSAELARSYKTQFGISVPEWRVLINLGYAGTGSVRDIEQRVSLEKSKVSRAVSRLVQKKYVNKCTDDGDKRLLRLTLTPSGTELLHELMPLALAYQRKLDAILSDEGEALQIALDLLEHAD